MPLRGRQNIPIKIGAGGWDGSFTVEKPVLKEGYVLASRFNENEAWKLANVGSHQANNDACAKQPHATAAAPPVAPKEITHSIVRTDDEEQEFAPADAIDAVNTNGNKASAPHHNSAAPVHVRDQLDSNASDFHPRASHTTVLPTTWDGTFAPGSAPPTRFRSGQQQPTNTNNFYGYTTEPEVLPTRWDGKFAPASGGGGPYRPKPSPYTNANNFYGFNSEPTMLPTRWDGKFAPAQPGNTYLVPERNQSMANDFYGYNSEPTVLPTQWSGKFETDPDDVRLRPERNGSDVRDYADHRNFREVKPTTTTQ